MQHKINNGWRDHFTPPAGQVIDNATGNAIADPMIGAVSQAITQAIGGSVALPPPPTAGMLVPPTVNVPHTATINTTANSVGDAFGRSPMLRLGSCMDQTQDPRARISACLH